MTTLKSVHRYLGLFAGVLWIFQIASGCVLVFMHELDNATVAGAAHAVSTRELGARLEALQRTGKDVSSMWVTNTSANRFDVFYSDASGTDRSMRVDGAGAVLRDGVEGAANNGGFLRLLSSLHISLSSGDVGKWILTLSAVLLFSNLVMGLTLAWPRAGFWRRALLPPTVKNRTARLYAVHRAIGLWAVVPALLIVTAGLCLLHADAIEEALGAGTPAPVSGPMSAPMSTLVNGRVNGPASAPAGNELSPAQALDIALARYPGATITMLAMPNAEAPWYRMRFHTPQESPRMYGATTLYLSAVDGHVLQEHLPASASPARVLLDGLYPFHTGTLFGLPGQLGLFILGISLLFLSIYGLRLWLARRR